MKNVFVINGFLEAGKTEFIKFTITQPYFQTTNTTLLILCEEGEIEIEEEILRKTHTVVEVIENKEDLNSTTLLNFEKKHKPERIIIEYNGMWQMSDLKMETCAAGYGNQRIDFFDVFCQYAFSYFRYGKKIGAHHFQQMRRFKQRASDLQKKRDGFKQKC